MQSAKDMAASAKSGVEKTKATLQEKGEKMTTRDPLQKEMATEKKEERIDEAERQKREARQRNAAAGGHPTGGVLGGRDPTTEYTAEEMGGARTGHGTGGTY